MADTAIKVPTKVTVEITKDKYTTKVWAGKALMAKNTWKRHSPGEWRSQSPSYWGELLPPEFSGLADDLEDEGCPMLVANALDNINDVLGGELFK